MNQPFDFQELVNLCEKTHLLLQQRTKQAVNAALVGRNWQLGRYIVEFEQNGADRSVYGMRLLDQLADRLGAIGIKGVGKTSLKLCRSLYLAYPEMGQTLPDLSRARGHPRKGQTLSDQSSAPGDSHAKVALLSWSHYVTLLSIPDPQERSFYEIEAAANDWSLRELKRQLNSSLYERLALSRDKNEIRRLAKEGQVVAQAADLIKNPYVLEFLGIEEKHAYSESDLESAIIDKLEQFLLELGKGFLFEARQKRFTLDEDHYFVDLVFYNRLLRCYTLIDLKIGELTHQDLGQMQMYVHHYDRHVRTLHENPTIGIVLCKRAKDALVEITLPEDSNIHASEYKLYLPTKEELRAQLEAVDPNASNA